MKYGLQDTTIEKISALLEYYPEVEQATLYGSRATGNYKNGSDIDLTLYGQALTFSTLNKIIDDLDSLFLPLYHRSLHFRQYHRPRYHRSHPTRRCYVL